MQIKTGTSLVAGAEKNRSGSRRILILGVGNILLRDEGIGVHAAKELQKQNLPANVEVIDGGTMGLDVLSLAAGVDKLVIVDALRSGRKPGAIYKIYLNTEQGDGIRQLFRQEKQSKISLHQVGLLDGLSLAERINRLPEEIVIIGVEPGVVDYGLELTEQVERKVQEIIKKVLEEIQDDIHTK
ncbi:MAG: HyaD/HybD family hydrogenase maturation endopeptidase [Planctomycetota bacterium]|nr:MAG: HyaD/HybD family hydrogenase maturation endopeptidase [Planctomycetota bacterium]